MSLRSEINGHLTNINGIFDQLTNAENNFLTFLENNLKGKTIVMPSRLKGKVIDIIKKEHVFFALIQWHNKKFGEGYISVNDEGFRIEE